MFPWDVRQTLGDEKKRALYDKYGAAAQQPGFSEEAYQRATSSFGGGGGFGSASDMFGGRGPADLNDIFSQMFGGGATRGGGGRGRAGATYSPGSDLQATVRIPFLEACRGTKRTIEITPVVDCTTCTGSGLKAGAKKRTCGDCGGSGSQQYIIQNGFAMSGTCRACDGAGTITDPQDACGGCGGVGKVRTTKKVEVDIPAGVDEGMRVVMGQMGDMPIEGKGRPGDLHVRIEIMPSRTFRRQGSNIYHDRSVPFYTAILGGRATVPTLEDDVQVRVPPGTQHGDELVLRGRGVPIVNKSSRGDLFVRFNVSIPRWVSHHSSNLTARLQGWLTDFGTRRSLTANQRGIIEAYAADDEGNNKPRNTVFEKEKPKARPAASEQAPSGKAAAAAAPDSASSAEAGPSNTTG